MKNAKSFSSVSIIAPWVVLSVVLALALGAQSPPPPLFDQADVRVLIDLCMSPTGEKIMQPPEPGTDRALFCAGLPFVALYAAVDVRNAQVRDQMIANQIQFAAEIAAIQQILTVNTPAIAALGTRVTALESLPPPPQGFFNGFEGSDLGAWSVPAGTSLAADTDAFTGTQSGRIGYGGSANPKSFNETGGVGIEVPENFALSYAGKTIAVSLRAKQPASGAASQFAVSYSTNDVGNSGWKQFTPTSDWQEFSFSYSVPPVNAGGADWIGIWGDTSKNNLAVLVDDVQIVIQ